MVGPDPGGDGTDRTDRTDTRHVNLVPNSTPQLGLVGVSLSNLAVQIVKILIK